MVALTNLWSQLPKLKQSLWPKQIEQIFLSGLYLQPDFELELRLVSGKHAYSVPNAHSCIPLAMYTVAVPW